MCARGTCCEVTEPSLKKAGCAETLPKAGFIFVMSRVLKKIKNYRFP